MAATRLLSPTHTVVAMARTLAPLPLSPTEIDTINTNGLHDLYTARLRLTQSAVEMVRANYLNEARYTLQSFDSGLQPREAVAEYCDGYRMAAEDRGAPGHQGQMLLYRETGELCFLQNTGVLSWVVYSERRLPSEAPLAGFDEEAKHLIHSLETAQ